MTAGRCFPRNACGEPPAPLDPQDVPRPWTTSPARQILVPDPCVGVKWYVPESHSGEAARLLDPRFELHIPTYFFTEAASVLQPKVAVDRTLSETEGLDASSNSFARSP